MQAVTFRLADSLPAAKLEEWAQELAHLDQNEIELERRRRIEAYLDLGLGTAWLRDSRVAHLVQEALLFFDGAAVQVTCMDNHAQSRACPLETRTGV